MSYIKCFCMGKLASRVSTASSKISKFTVLFSLDKQSEYVRDDDN